MLFATKKKRSHELGTYLGGLGLRAGLARQGENEHLHSWELRLYKVRRPYTHTLFRWEC